MEAFETFKKLSDSEQVKFFEAFVNSSKEHFSNSCDETSHTRRPEKSNLSILLENLKSWQKKVCDGNSPDSKCEVGDPREKQKTLDSWLIKRNDISPNKSKLEESPCQIKLQADTGSSSYVNNVPESCSDLVQTTVNNANSPCFLNSVPNENEFSISTKHSYCDSDKAKDGAVKSALTFASNAVESSDITEKYHLKSKRKFIELSPIAEHENAARYFKNGDNNLVNDCDNSLDKLNRKIARTSGISTVPYCSLPEGTEISTSQDIFNHIQHSEEKNCDNTKNLNVSFDNRKPYNLRTKRKNLKLQSSLESNQEFPSGKITSGGLNNKIRNVRSNHQVTRTTSPQSNYEAFCKLDTECSQIGLNIIDILKQEKIQNLLNDHEKLSNEAVVFLGSFKSSTGEKLPIVHLLESKKRLLSSLHELKKSP